MHIHTRNNSNDYEKCFSSVRNKTATLFTIDTDIGVLHLYMVRVKRVTVLFRTLVKMLHSYGARYKTVVGQGCYHSYFGKPPSI